MTRRNVLGDVYNRMTVIAEAGLHKGSRMRRVIAKCECGNIKEVLLASLRNGASKSCGCLHKEVTYKHGHSTANSRLYRIWANMRDRCTNPKNGKYLHYGARGITVCTEWVESFDTFKTWAINGYDKGLSIDRRDNDKGYYPDNCRWADPVTQSRNQRARKEGTSKYTGVHWSTTTNKWVAMIGLSGKKKHLGLYEQEIDAAIARDSYIVREGLTDFRMNNVL